MTLPVEELEALIKDLRWEHFEADPLGQIQVGNKLFCMRIGIHMNRPVQAIIADGQFVRMRSAEFYDDKKLHKIDPDRLAECLYMDAQQQAYWPKWRPFMADQAKIQNELMKAAQTQNLGSGGILGGLGSGLSSGARIKMMQAQAEIAHKQAEIAHKIAIEEAKVAIGDIWKSEDGGVNWMRESKKRPSKLFPWSKVRWEDDY